MLNDMKTAAHNEPNDTASRSEPDDTAGRMRTVITRLGRRLRRTAAGGDLSPSQYDVLATIVRRGPLRLSELAVIEGLNPTMLSRIVGKLETDGLVRRTQDRSDGRVAHLAATAEGRKLHERILRERTETLNLLLDNLDQDQRQALVQALPVLESLAEALRDRP